MAYATGFSFTKMSTAIQNSAILNIGKWTLRCDWSYIAIISPIYLAILFNIVRPRFTYGERNLCGVVKIIRHARPFSSIVRYSSRALPVVQPSRSFLRKRSKYCKYFTPMVERGSPDAPRHAGVELYVRNNERYSQRLHFTLPLVGTGQFVICCSSKGNCGHFATTPVQLASLPATTHSNVSFYDISFPRMSVSIINSFWAKVKLLTCSLVRHFPCNSQGSFYAEDQQNIIFATVFLLINLIVLILNSWNVKWRR